MPRDGREAANYSRQLDHRRREEELLALATRQFGIVAYGQLASLGYCPADVHYRAARGRLHRLHRGVYALGRPDVPVEGRRLAAVLACGDGAVLSHISAAAHHGLRQSAATKIDVTVPRRSALRRPGVRIHRLLSLIPADVVVVDEVPCTSVARTLLDIAPLLRPRALEKAVEQAHILEVYDHRAVLDVIERAAGRSGVHRLRRVLGITRPGETVTKSGLEEALLALCRQWGLPEPSVNGWVRLAGEYFQCDFVWHRQRFVVEVDSYKFHRTRGAFLRDRRRDQLLDLEGWSRTRIADVQISDEPELVKAVLRRNLGL